MANQINIGNGNHIHDANIGNGNYTGHIPVSDAGSTPASPLASVADDYKVIQNQPEKNRLRPVPPKPTIADVPAHKQRKAIPGALYGVIGAAVAIGAMFLANYFGLI